MDFHDYENKIILEKFLEYRKEKYRYKCRDKYWIISFIVSSMPVKSVYFILRGKSMIIVQS